MDHNAFQHLTTSPQTSPQVNALLERAAHDPFFAKIINLAASYGLHIRRPVWPGRSLYRPSAVRVNAGGDTVINEPLHLPDHAAGAVLTLPRYGGAAPLAHDLLHELVHLYQDMHGLFLIPLLRRGHMPVIPDMRSALCAHLFCEALAETETIRAAHRLQRAGFPEFLEGARRSTDWRVLARSYAHALEKGYNEDEAAAHILMQWYALPARRFYERRATALYRKNLDLYLRYAGTRPAGLNALQPSLRRIDVPALISLLPETKGAHFAYLKKLDVSVTRALSADSIRALEHFEHHYGTAERTGLDDFTHGSPAYLWRDAHTKN